MTETIEGIEQQTAQTPEETGGEKRFTQAELDRIIGERLARAKADRQADKRIEERERALKARESRMDCCEYIDGKKYPLELMDILPTADFDQFKAAANKLAALFDSRDSGGPYIRVDTGASLTGSGGSNTDPIANAFKPKR